MKRKLWAVLLSSCLLTGAPPMTVLAGGEETSASLIVGGVELEPEESGEGEGWSYDGDYTLTLENYDGPWIRFIPYDGHRSWLNIVVQGTDNLESIGLGAVDSTVDGPELWRLRMAVT